MRADGEIDKNFLLVKVSSHMVVKTERQSYRSADLIMYLNIYIYRTTHANVHPIYFQLDVITDISFGGGRTSQPVHLDDVQCDGTEPNLLNCTHSATVDSGCREHGQDIGIICKRSQGSDDHDSEYQ